MNLTLNSLSKTEEVFKESIQPYQNALDEAGHNYKLNYQPKTPNPTPTTNRVNNTSRKNRSRNITWFNPPYCKSLKTNLGKEFFKLLLQCFPKENSLSKIFNRNTVKLSFSCMSNMGRIISAHNKKVKEPEKVVPQCVCTREECPVDG